MTRLRAAGVREWAVGLAALALVVRLPFLFGRHAPPPNDDGWVFLSLANGLVHGKGFQGHHFWTPGYPTFEAALQLLPGRTADAVTIAQHLLGVALVAAIVVLGWRWFGRLPAIVAGLLAALTPVLVVHEHTLLPDFIFGLLVLGGAVALAEALRSPEPRRRLLVLAGVAFGAATWTKPAGEFLLVAAPPALLFATRSLRRTLVDSAIVAAALLVTVAPWVVRNAVDFGVVGMSDQGGRVLYYRVFGVSGLPVPTDTPDGRFVAGVEARLPVEYPAQREVNVHNALIRQRGLNDDSAGDVEQRLALTAVRRHPWAYTRDTASLLKTSLTRLQNFDGEPELRAELARTDPPYPTWLTRQLWKLARLVTDVWWIASLSALAGLLMLFVGPRASRNAAAALLSVWLALSLGTVATHGGLWRYSVQLAAIVWILGSAGAVLVVSSVVAAVRGSRRPTGSPV